MDYFIINDIDFSVCVNQLKINKEANYNAQTNAAGDTVVDYINSKRIFEVGIIPLNNRAMIDLMNVLEEFNVTITFLNPTTGELEENVNCIIPSTNVEYYTIQVNNVMFKAFTLQFIEL